MLETDGYGESRIISVRAQTRLQYRSHPGEFGRECLAIRKKRKLNSIDVIDVLTDLFILRSVPGYIRSDNGPEFVAEVDCSEPSGLSLNRIVRAIWPKSLQDGSFQIDREAAYIEREFEADLFATDFENNPP